MLSPNLLPPFKLERYFAQYEFSVKYLLSASDCEALSVSELLALADADSRARWEHLSLSYTESQGLPALREEIARMYPGLSPDDVLILTPEEGIYIAMRTLLAPGDHIISVFPAYQSLYELARSMGCTVTPWQVRPIEGGWTLDVDELRRSITPRTRLLVVNAPHNPTGYLPARALWDEIIAVAAQHGLIVFSDEMYRGLEYDPAQRLPPLCSAYERGISLSGLSKSLACPGLRIGWLATRQQVMLARWLSYRDYTTICSSAPSEVLALMVLRARETIVARNLDIIRANLATAERFFADHVAHFTWRAPLAGSVAFPEWNGAQSVDEFCEALVAQHGVMIVPGRIFDMPGNHFRLGLGRRNFLEAMECVRDFLTNASG